MLAHDIRPIDLLVVNLYPFEATVRRGAALEDCIENIDIGGPAMIRGAAKNHADVAVVVDVADYAALEAELARTDGSTGLAFRRGLAQKAYARTAAYDAAIADHLAGFALEATPTYRTLGGTLAEALRYGENPHQRAGFYRSLDARPGGRVRTADAGQGASPTTTSPTPTRPSNSWRNSTPPGRQRSRSSSTRTPAASARRRAPPRLTGSRCAATRSRPSAASWR